MPTASIDRRAASRAARRPEPGQFCGGVDEVPARHPLVKCVLLRTEADQAVERRVVPHLLAQHAHRPLAGVKLPGGQLQQGRLPRPIGTEQPGDAGVDPQVQLVDADHVAVPLRDVVKLDNRRHRSRSSERMERLRMHAEIPNRPASTTADQYQGYCGPR